MVIHVHTLSLNYGNFVVGALWKNHTFTDGASAYAKRID